MENIGQILKSKREELSQLKIRKQKLKQIRNEVEAAYNDFNEE